MATNSPHSIALHLRGSYDDSRFVDEFMRAGVAVISVNLLADAVAALDETYSASPSRFAIAPAQQGGIALLELLSELDLLQQVEVVLIDHACDARTAIKALRLGAADYFIPATPLPEVQSRIQVLLNGKSPAQDMSVEATEPNVAAADPFSFVTAGDLPENISINTNLRAIRKGDMWVSLSPIEWRLFEELIHNRGRVVIFAELVRRGLNRERVSPSETSLLRLHMSRLRAKLNAHFDRELNIITLRGRGYMLA